MVSRSLSNAATLEVTRPTRRVSWPSNIATLLDAFGLRPCDIAGDGFKEFDIVPDMQRLRRSMLGSPLTSERPTQKLDRLPNDIKRLLRKIGSYLSKASASYYYRFFSAYFVDLQASMRNIAKVLKSGAAGCMVVQSSHYKEIEIDLPGAVISLAEQLGLRHQKTKEFDSRRSMSLVNSRAHADAQKPKSEAAVFFKKD